MAGDARSVGRPVQLEIGARFPGQNPITPSSLSPQIFNHGVAEAYLVYPQAGRVTIQVKGGAGELTREAAPSEWPSQIEGLFYKTRPDRTDIYVIANGAIEYRVSQPTNFRTGVNAVVVTFPNSNLLKSFDYDAIDLPGIRGAKLSAESGGAPRLVLKLDAAYGYTMDAKSNLFQITLRSGQPIEPPALVSPSPGLQQTSAIPSLADIQNMIDAMPKQYGQQAPSGLGQILMGQAMMYVLQQASESAQRMGDEYISVEHLLLAF